MKTFYQFNESIGKALAKFGSIGLRKASKAVTSSSFKSKIQKTLPKSFEFDNNFSSDNFEISFGQSYS